MSRVEATDAAAAQLRVRARAEGVVGMPGVRLRPVSGNRPDAFELVIEDRREAGDEVHESHGIRFYIPGALASRLGDTTLDVSGEEFVLRVGGSPQR